MTIRGNNPFKKEQEIPPNKRGKTACPAKFVAKLLFMTARLLVRVVRRLIDKIYRAIDLPTTPA